MSDTATYREAFLCGIRDWSEFWGDPLLSGTIFMVSYLGAALAILAVARRSSGRERLYWRLCGWLFIFQVANTHLDLHGLVWTIGRCLAHAQGWYQNRQEVQILLLLGLAWVTVLLLLVVLAVFGRNIAGNLVLTLGVAIALGFTVVKGISYSALTGMVNRKVGPFPIADYIEYSGIVLATLAAAGRLWAMRNEE